MLLLLIDALILGAVILFFVLVVRDMVRKSRQRELEQALFRQQVAEDLAKQVDRLDPETIRLHEEKIKSKLDGLQ